MDQSTIGLYSQQISKDFELVAEEQLMRKTTLRVYKHGKLVDERVIEEVMKSKPVKIDWGLELKRHSHPNLCQEVWMPNIQTEVKPVENITLPVSVPHGAVFYLNNGLGGTLFFKKNDVMKDPNIYLQFNEHSGGWFSTHLSKEIVKELKRL